MTIFSFLWKNICFLTLVRVGLAPLAHRHAEAGLEEGLEVELVSESAHPADGADRDAGPLEELLDFAQPRLLDAAADGAPVGLAVGAADADAVAPDGAHGGLRRHLRHRVLADVGLQRGRR